MTFLCWSKYDVLSMTIFYLPKYIKCSKLYIMVYKVVELYRECQSRDYLYPDSLEPYLNKMLHNNKWRLLQILPSPIVNNITYPTLAIFYKE